MTTPLKTIYEALSVPEAQASDSQAIVTTEKSLIDMTFSEISERKKYREGVRDGINSVKHAISDGLRHGSPECGRLMSSF